VEADPRDARNTGHAFERLWNVIFNGKADLNRPDGPTDSEPVWPTTLIPQTGSGSFATSSGITTTGITSWTIRK
jgi:hypothetical protein